MKKLAWLFAIASTLTGCGGSDDSAIIADGDATSPASTPAPATAPPREGSPAAAPASAPQGSFSGADRTFMMVHLEDGSVWGIESGPAAADASTGPGGPIGLFKATVAYSDWTFTSNEFRYSRNGGNASDGSLSGTYLDDGRLTNTFLSPAGPVTVITERLSTSIYDYDHAATLADLARGWTGDAFNGGITMLDVSPSGDLTGRILGCELQGTASPRASGKNVFDVAVTFHASDGCGLAPETYRGIAIVLNGGVLKETMVAVANATGTSALAWRGSSADTPSGPRPMTKS